MNESNFNGVAFVMMERAANITSVMFFSIQAFLVSVLFFLIGFGGLQ